MEQHSNGPVAKRGKSLGFVIIGIVLVAVFGLGILFSSMVFRNEIVTEVEVIEIVEVEVIVELEPIVVPVAHTHTTWLHEMDWFFANPRAVCNHWHCWHGDMCASINGWVRGGNWGRNVLDNAGNAHNGAIFAGTYNRHQDNGHSITFLINGEYTSFTGVIALSRESRDAQLDYCIHIYADDVRVLHTPNITGGVPPISFDIDVTGVEQIRIVRVAQGRAEVGIFGAGFHR